MLLDRVLLFLSDDVLNVEIGFDLMTYCHIPF